MYSQDDDMYTGEAQQSDGVVHGDEMGPTCDDAHAQKGKKGISDEINAFLMQPRFDGDICITLSMPESYLKKARDKVNQALWKVYDKYKNPGFGMFDVLLTLEPLVDVVKLNAVLDMDVKLLVAKEKGIRTTEDELEYVVKHPAGDRKKTDGDIVECPTCHGTGEVDGSECPMCLGNGKVVRVVGDVPRVDSDSDEDAELNMDELEAML